MSRFLLKNYWVENKLFTRRILVAIVMIAILLAILLGRLFYLQIIQHTLYTTLSDENQLTLIPLSPNRGLIYDRNGILLAENIPIFSLDVIPERTHNFKKELRDIKEIIEISPEMEAQFQKIKRQKRTTEGIPLKLNLTEEEVARFYLTQFRFPGFQITARLMRHYPLGGSTVAALGYVSRISEDELGRLDPTNYAATNYVGKTGIEKFYEKILHGTVGYQQVETDANGRVVRTLKKIPPHAGADLYLSLDSQLQQVGEAALADEQGAIVALEPKTGQILAFVSHPQYDPNPFVRGITFQEYSQLKQNPQLPLYNRPLRGLYPSGSIIKPILGVQILNKNIASPTTFISDPGYFSLPHSSHVFKDWNWHQGGHGRVNIHKAIVESCDVYFYTMASRMGIDLLHQIEALFGLGALTGIDVGEELAGVSPSPAWKKKVLKQSWYPGDTVNASTGQGYTLVTPLQMAVVAATIANHGFRYAPRFVEKIKYPEQPFMTLKPKSPAVIQLTQDAYWDIIIEAMQGVIEEPQGTAHGSFFPNLNYTAAGKTGTAEVFRPKSYGDKDHEGIPKKYRSHSWFIVFAPVEDPKIAVAVLVENHPHQAPLIARKIIDYFLLPNHGV